MGRRQVLFSQKTNFLELSSLAGQYNQISLTFPDVDGNLLKVEQAFFKN